MTPAELSRTVLHAVLRAVDEGELRVGVPARAVVTPPGPGGCGDYATNIALQLAGPAGQTPHRVAEILRPHLIDADGISDVVVTGPGFLNIRLRSSAPVALVEEILRKGLRYGHADGPGADHALGDAPGAPVSDAPAAPAHEAGVASGRPPGAAPGRASVAGPAHASDAASGHPPDATVGHAPIGAGAASRAGHAAPVRLHCPPEVRALVVMDAVARILRSQGVPVRTVCEACPDAEWVALLGLRLDGYDDGTASPSSGTPTAPAAPESPSAARATTPPAFPAAAVARSQPVRPVPAPADPLPLGRDAARWALLYPAAHDRPRIGGGHLVQREGNPLFRVRYAHARTRALVRNAADLGFVPEPGEVTGVPAGRELLAVLADHPRVLGAAARHRAPDRLARHLVAVADAVLPFLPAVLPRGEEKPSAAHRARLALAEAAGTVLAGGLSLLGIDAPDHL